MDGLVLVLRAFLIVVWLLILARTLISWFPATHHNELVQRLFEVTDLILEPIRRLLPPMGGFDLSPMAALVVIYVLQRVLDSFA